MDLTGAGWGLHGAQTFLDDEPWAATVTSTPPGQGTSPRNNDASTSERRPARHEVAPAEPHPTDAVTLKDCPDPAGRHEALLSPIASRGRASDWRRQRRPGPGYGRFGALGSAR